MALDIDTVYRDHVIKGDIHSGQNEPDKAEIRSLLKALFGAASNPSIVKQTQAALDAVTPASENYGGVVLNDPDPTKNGYYYRSSSTWVKGRGFPDTFAQITLGGGANAQTGTVAAGVNPADALVYFATVSTDNTGPLTLSISGETARDVVNAAGNALSAGEWTGTVLFFLNGDGDYQLLIDAGAAAAAAQSASEAQTWAEAAEAIAIPPGSLDTAKLEDEAVTRPKLGSDVMARANHVYTSRAAFEADGIEADVPIVTIIDGGVVVTLVRTAGGAWQSNDGEEWDFIDRQGVAKTTVSADLQGYGWVVGDPSGGNIKSYGAGTILTNLHTGQPNILANSRHLRGIIGGYDNWITGGTIGNVGGGVSTGVDGGEACWIVGSHHSEVIGQSTHAAIFGGSTLIVDGHYSSAFGGSQITITGDYAFVGGGVTNVVATATAGTITGGRNNKVTADYSRAAGRNALAHIANSDVFGGGGFTNDLGRFQGVDIFRSGVTTNATQTNLGTMVLRDHSTIVFDALIVGRRTDSGLESGGYFIRGMIHRGSGAATTALVGTPEAATVGETDAAWGATVAASTGAGGLQILVTGASGKTVMWGAKVRAVELCNTAA